MVFTVLCFTDSYDMRSNQGWLWEPRQKTCMGNYFINLLTQFLQPGLLSLGRKNEEVRCSMITKKGVLNGQICMQETQTLVFVTQGLLCPGRIPQCPIRAALFFVHS